MSANPEIKVKKPDGSCVALWFCLLTHVSSAGRDFIFCHQECWACWHTQLGETISNCSRIWFSYACNLQLHLIVYHIDMAPFLEGLWWIHLLNRTGTKYVPWLKPVAESYQSGNILQVICIICRWKSNEKGIWTDFALLSGSAMHNSMWYPDIISCNVILQFKCLSLLQKKTHVNKSQTSMTDIWDKINCTSLFRSNQPSLFQDTGLQVVSYLLAEGEERVVSENTHWCLIFSVLQWLLSQPWCQSWVYFKEHYQEQNRRPSILMIWTRKIAFSVQINYPNHRVFCIHFNEITIYFIESWAFLLQIRHIYMINTWNLKGWLN